MPRLRSDGTKPDWQHLCEIAASQGGYFSAAQAREAGYSAQLLQHYLRTRKIEREARSLYHLAFYPRGERDDLILDWLWSGCQAVASHDTALSIHGLSDILPVRRHFSVPASWERRRLEVPRGLVLYYGLPPEEDRTWYGCVPVTRPLRTLLDCQAVQVSPDLLEQARRQGIARGLFTRDDLRRAEREAGSARVGAGSLA